MYYCSFQVGDVASKIEFMDKVLLSQSSVDYIPDDLMEKIMCIHIAIAGFLWRT